MATEKTPESIRALVVDITRNMEKLPENSTPADLAATLDAMPDLEKALRKKKQTWTTALIRGSRQAGL